MIGQSKCLWLKDLERDERTDLVERGTRIDREVTEMDEGALEACDKWKRRGGRLGRTSSARKTSRGRRCSVSEGYVTVAC